MDSGMVIWQLLQVLFNFLIHKEAAYQPSLPSTSSLTDWFPILPGLPKSNKIVIKYAPNKQIYKHGRKKEGADIEKIYRHIVYKNKAINDFGTLCTYMSNYTKNFSPPQVK